MVLSPRLALVYQLCGDTRRIIDVGCDHAQLAICLAESGAFVFASDVKPGPLERAEAAVAASGRQGRIKTVLCDGLSAFSEQDADTIVIAGLGGETIMDILAKSPWAFSKTLVLQPQSRADKLRRFLFQNGCGITQERLAREQDRIYSALSAARGGAQDLSHNHWLFSESMKGDRLFPQYIKKLLKTYRAACAARVRGGHAPGRFGEIVSMLMEMQVKGAMQCHLIR